VDVRVQVGTGAHLLLPARPLVYEDDDEWRVLLLLARNLGTEVVRSLHEISELGPWIVETQVGQ